MLRTECQPSILRTTEQRNKCEIGHIYIYINNAKLDIYIYINNAKLDIYIYKHVLQNDYINEAILSSV